MIIKLGESLQWERYHHLNKTVNALRMREDFIYETPQGWVKGYKDQWLVELGDSLRCNLDHEAFFRNYKPRRRMNANGPPS